MKGLKMTAKRILTGVLTAAMVVTSVNLPGMATSVQAATVYNDTATALSELSGSTGLKIYRLTSADAGKELTSGIYYVDEDLTFTGADSTSSGQPGGNGLKIADGATVYLYIAEGKTLTATGGNGYDATAGVAGEDGSITFSSGTYSNTTFNVRYRTDTQGKSKAGGNGASGGGAGIFVPQNASFAVMGQGKLNATGGAGGNAQIGGQGGKTNYYYTSFEVYSGNTSPVYSQVLKSLNDYPNLSITKNTQDDAVTMAGTGATGAGGSGGGGAGGGGAAVGSNGSNGSIGGQGGATSTRETIGNGSTASTVSSGTSGKIYIQGVNVSSCVAGAGGSTRSQQYSAKANTTLDYKDYYDVKGVNGKYISLKFYITEGQAGGVGGAGGNGAVFGNGGSGGAGGTGGNSGSFRDSYDKYTSCAGDAKVGANGSAGTSGTGNSSTLGDTQYPYNNITFTNLTSANTKYYLTKPSTFTAPVYSVSENQIFVGWKVTIPAVALPEAFGETADTQLTTADTIIPAGTEVSTAGIYGNITLEPYAVSHTHSWTYETDSTDNSKVYAWCVGEENADACPYHGEEKKLTLSLDAEGKTYDGNAYNGATVEDKITSVTKATAGSVTYYETGSDGNKTGSAISAPVNAGKYVAEVTVSDGNKSASATKTFEIKRADQTATVSMSGYEYGKTVSTPDVSGAKESPSVTYYYSTEDKNTDGTEWKNIENDTLEPGTYYMYAVLAQTDNYNTYTTAPVSFTVQGSDMSGVTAADVTKTYDGSSYGITVNTGSIPNATVTYGTEAGTYDLTDCPAYKNVGTYTIYYKVEARGYNSFTGSATVTITKKAVTATVTAKNKTYDGTTDATVSAEVDSKDLVSGDSITINGITGAFADKNAGTDKKVTVDSSKAEFTGTGVDNYDIKITAETTASIMKAKGSITDISDISKTYDGSAVTAPTFTTANDRGTDDANVTIEYKKQGAEDSTYTSEAPKDYGKYVVRIAVKADDNHEAVTITKDFSIHKKEMIVSAEGYTGTYDGQAYGITVNVTEPADNAASNVKVVYGTKGADGKITYSENHVTYKDAGEYTVYYKVTADNYEDAEGSAVIKIAPKTVSLVWSDTEFTYDGKAHKPTAKVNEDDIIDSDSVEVTVSGEQKNAGSAYTAKAVSLDNGNYVLSKLTEDVAITFVIKPATVTVTVGSATKHIGKNDPVFTYKAVGLVSGETLEDISLTRSEGETAGDYDITATAKDGSNANYDVTFVAGKLTIENHVAVKDEAKAATCTETGLTEGSHCSVCDEVLVEQTVVEALGHDWSEWVKVGNREKSTCSRCGQVKYRNIDSSDTGSIEKDAEVTPDSPVKEVVLENSKSELMTADGIFTAEDKSAIESGADARVWLEISAATDISDSDKQNVEAEAQKIMGSDISKVVYFDADLFKSVTKDGTTTKSQITEPGTDIEVSVSLPESLVQADSTISRAYKIIRLHNGEVDSFDAAFDKETGTLTFKTDRFSTYAIAFTDTQLVTGIILTPDSKTLTKKGETVQLTAAVTPNNAADKKVTWTSSDSSVATVDENGLVTAVADGTAIITVTTEDGGKTATVKITVNISSDDDNSGDNGNNNSDNNNGNSNNSNDNNGNNGNNSSNNNNSNSSTSNPATIPDNKNNQINQSAAAPKTGDTSNPMLWVTVMMGAFAGLVGLLSRKKKECK